SHSVSPRQRPSARQRAASGGVTNAFLTRVPVAESPVCGTSPSRSTYGSGVTLLTPKARPWCVRERPMVRRIVLLATLALAVDARAIVVKDNLYGVKAMSPTEAWAVGNFGSIYHTTDAGKTWVARESGTKLPLFAVDFADAAHGWIVGKSSTILATTDGGKTWKPEKSAIPPEKHLFNLKAIDARTVWVVGDWGAMATTHDGGATWEDRPLAEDVVLYAVSFPDPQHGFIAGEFGTLLATADGGRTWEKRPV